MKLELRIAKDPRAPFVVELSIFFGGHLRFQAPHAEKFPSALGAGLAR